MKENRVSVFNNGLIWFGAGVSIAEIITGTYFASLGFSRAMLAIVIGHIIGGFLMFLAGYMGAKTKLTSMETVKIGFGNKGGLIFALLNVVQLVGWTAIMIYDGALAANGIFSVGTWLWAIIIGGLIILWIVIGIENLGKINLVAMIGLFALTLVLSVLVFKGHNLNAGPSKDAMSFGAALELAVAMPLSWLPVISDYTRRAEKPLKATTTSVIAYNIVSIWMYAIGLGLAIFTKETDIAIIMLKAGFGILGLALIVFSTVTTAFLDAISAGFSFASISSKISAKMIGILTGIIGIICAVLFPMDDITNFLYFIGSVFAPMIAILIVEFYILKNQEIKNSFNIRNIVIWIVGFVIYRYMLDKNLNIGSSLPDILITMILAYLVGKFVPSKN
ncbi:putative hydroxymethylpyrimidine transporter CytX [Peptostreptococcus equinus]|uniref:Hydroxymethylpyrimidine transporter CytX n=1 Tax=Peptostreptococcus equinus TaxID=3003601 RepID=A0ABY7JPM3_9FIRM|nr:putative hydroxymethylpyrimidine transporter CytX [Peptostreptococcus sp. CBA3647]WAW15109.1 putative hydroxymethylpyrimidine transporter CytX [Peptostreptococcus sp. CBA3647]